MWVPASVVTQAWRERERGGNKERNGVEWEWAWYGQAYGLALGIGDARMAWQMLRITFFIWSPTIRAEEPPHHINQIRLVAFRDTCESHATTITNGASTYCVVEHHVDGQKHAEDAPHDLFVVTDSKQ